MIVTTAKGTLSYPSISTDALGPTIVVVETEDSVSVFVAEGPGAADEVKLYYEEVFGMEVKPRLFVEVP